MYAAVKDAFFHKLQPVHLVLIARVHQSNAIVTIDLGSLESA